MEHTQADIDLFNSRFIHQSMYQDWTESALHIFYKNVDVNDANNNCLQPQGNPIIQIKSQHAIKFKQHEENQKNDMKIVNQLLAIAETPN